MRDEKIPFGNYEAAAIVTGAAGGMGQIYAGILAENGYNLILVDISAARLEQTVSEVTALVPSDAGFKVLPLVLDLSEMSAASEIGRAASEFGYPVEILINNAGIYPFADIEDLDFETWDRVIKVNLYSQYYMCKAVIPNMKKNGWGRIVNFTSDSINMAIPGISHYMASKMGIIGFTRGLAADVAGYGINVNALGPALTPTPGVESYTSLSE